MDFAQFDHAFRIDNEGTAQGNTVIVDQDIEVTADLSAWIADHRELDFLDGVRCVVPALVNEMGIGRNGVDFHTQFLEFFVMVSQIAQFGRANKREVGRIEEYDRPFAFQVCIGNFDELARCDKPVP